MDYQTISLATTVLTAIVALFGTTLALFEYHNQGKNRQIDSLLAWRSTFEEVARRHDLLARLTDDDPALRELPFPDRAEILGLLEAIATSMAAKNLNEDQAFNFFGYYAIRIAASEHFLHDIPKDSVYWKEFSAFSTKMKAIETRRAAGLQQGR